MRSPLWKNHTINEQVCQALLAPKTRYNPTNESPIKNAPNPFFNNADGNTTAKPVPSAENNKAGIIAQKIPCVCNSPLSACVFNAPILMGRKENRFALCAIFCSTPPSNTNSGIVTVYPAEVAGADVWYPAKNWDER